MAVWKARKTRRLESGHISEETGIMASAWANWAGGTPMWKVRAVRASAINWASGWSTARKRVSWKATGEKPTEAVKGSNATTISFLARVSLKERSGASRGMPAAFSRLNPARASKSKG